MIGASPVTSYEMPITCFSTHYSKLGIWIPKGPPITIALAPPLSKTTAEQREGRNQQKLCSVLTLESNTNESFMKFTFSSSESEGQGLEDEEMDFQKRVHTRSVKSGVNVFNSHDILKF